MACILIKLPEACAIMVRYKGKDRTVVRVLRDQVGRFPDGLLIHTESRDYSRKEVDKVSNRIAHGLQRLGVTKGATVLLMLPNTEMYIFVWLGLAKLGAIEVPVHTAYKGQMLSQAINESRATVIIVHETFLAPLHAVQDQLAILRNILVVSPGSAVPTFSTKCQVTSFDDCISDDDSALSIDPRYNDTLALMYTSGTTGPSKGVLVTNAHAFEYANAVVDVLEIKDGDIYYAPLPLFHIAGQWAVVYAALMSNASAVIKETFSASTFWQDIERFKANVGFLMGAMATFIYKQPEHPNDASNCLERLLLAPLVPNLDSFRKRFNVKISTCYASTEANVPIVASFEVKDPKQCGIARKGWEVEIVDEDDEKVPAGVAGEIVVRPPEPWLTMRGYLNRADATAEAYRNTWLHTGDMGFRDAHGNFYFVDRMKDAIRRRGENISSFEVEREVNAYPSVLESAAVAVKSEHTEDEIMIVVIPRQGKVIDPRELHQFLAGRVPKFMIPRYIKIVGELPKTHTGKIQKNQLRDSGSQGRWDALAPD